MDFLYIYRWSNAKTPSSIAARMDLEMDLDEQWRIAQSLKQCLIALDSSQSDAVIGKGAGWEVWQPIMDLVKTLSEIVLSCLPNFWKIAKMYMEGKFKKVGLITSLVWTLIGLT